MLKSLRNERGSSTRTKGKSRKNSIRNFYYHPSTSKIFSMIALIIILCIMVCGTVNAAEDQNKAVDKIDQLTGMIAGIFIKIGAVVIFLGALQVAWGIKSENPDSKANGIKTAAAGAAVIVIAGSYSTFIS